MHNNDEGVLGSDNPFLRTKYDRMMMKKFHPQDSKMYIPMEKQASPIGVGGSDNPFLMSKMDIEMEKKFNPFYENEFVEGFCNRTRRDVEEQKKFNPFFAKLGKEYREEYCGNNSSNLSGFQDPYNKMSRFTNYVPLQ